MVALMVVPGVGDDCIMVERILSTAAGIYWEAHSGAIHFLDIMLVNLVLPVNLLKG